MTAYSCGRGFVDSIRPALETGDLESILQQLRHHWPNRQLRELLHDDFEDASKVALFCLSLVGTMEDCAAISSLLKHSDSYIAKLAEHTLWSIWFHSGRDEAANMALWKAVLQIGHDALQDAERCLTSLLRRCPEFAEAYNQRAIAFFLSGDYERARADLEEAIRLNPHHFAALASLGHCAAALGDCDRALACYERVLELHPGWEGLAENLQEVLDSCCSPTCLDDDALSGEPTLRQPAAPKHALKRSPADTSDDLPPL